MSLGTRWGLFLHYWVVFKLLITAFAIWYAVARPSDATTTTPAGTTMGTVISKVVQWDVAGEVSTFSAMGGVPWFGAALAAVLVGGLVVAWRPMRWSTYRTTQFAPVALLVGGVAFLTLTGYARWMMGGMGHEFDGGYAEFVAVPAA